jgi:predicted deacylase
MSDSAHAFEVLPRDLGAYRRGNTGIDYVHRFESGRPGPHVLINALTHGNEICGMVAATHLLDTGVRPRIGTLTVSFANVEAYEAFDPARPYDNRQLVHNMNRIWSAEMLDGDEHSPELRRARELRPVVAAADHILDIHSTRSDVPPFWVYPAFERNAVAAMAIGRPAIHLQMPGGIGTGVVLTQHGRHGDDHGPGAAVVVECGQHFARSAAELATEVSFDFLAHFGLVDRVVGTPSAAEPQRRFELLQTHVVKSTDFMFTRPLVGFEVFDRGELIARNGDEEIRAPIDGCTVFMPTQEPIVGREAVYLTRAVD